MIDFETAGETFLYWYGTEPRICISEAELVKQILSNKFGFYQKPNIRPSLQTLVGNSIGRANGEQWARRRRILNPAFTLDKLKVLINNLFTPFLTSIIFISPKPHDSIHFLVLLCSFEDL